MRKTLSLAFLLLIVWGLTALAESKYEVEVDASNQIVTVYLGSDRSDEAIVRQMICSTGKNGSTPKGTFFVFTRERTDRQEWYWIKYYSTYVQYVTRFYNDYMFHSLPYAQKDLSSIDQTALARMGTAASHGCIRLYSEDAKWLSENLEDGSKVHIFVTKETKDELTKMLMRRGFSSDEWISYAEYRGYSEREGVVSRASAPEDVMGIQSLLRDYGRYGGAIDGQYTLDFMDLIYDLQVELGLSPTGMADADFRAALDAGTLAPGTQALLAPGSSGPAVRQLQQALSTLGYYTGELDGVFADSLAESLLTYRAVHRLEADSSADSAFQQRLLDEAAQLDLPEGVHLVVREVEYEMARVLDDVVLAVRRSPSREAKLLRYAKPEDEVFLLDQSDDHWAYVRVGDQEGYVLSDYLTYYTKIFLDAFYE